MDTAKFFRGVWLNFLLFGLTVLSTFFVGLNWSLNFKYAGSLNADSSALGRNGLFRDGSVVALSVVYAVVLLVILLGHELGHYLACRRYRISATLPYFMPAPTLIGTLGAFIKIRSPITRKNQLFDIGIAGPLTSFVLALPALIIGLSMSRAVPSLPREDALVFGEPLILKLIGAVLFKDVSPGQDIILHPVAFAGWVGILVTGLNLFPLGQLDGGHIFYAAVGRKSKATAKFFLAAYFVLGIFFWIGWIVWALLILVLGLKHPQIADEEEPLSASRKFLTGLVVVIFALSFIPDPVQSSSLLDILQIAGLFG